VTFARARAARGGTSLRGAGAAALLACAVCVASTRAHAQAIANPTPARPAFPPDLVQPLPVVSVRAQRPVEPLPAPVAIRLQRAIDLRIAGLPERAVDTLQVLLRERPHHPAIVTELGRAELARGNWSTVERLGVAERSAARDSSLLGQELATALERLGKPRDAIKVAIEAWTVSPADGPWASGVVFRLAPTDPRTTLAALEAAATPRPWRTDLAIGHARMLAVSGKPADAARVLADAEKRAGRTGLRVLFADESLRTGRPADTTAALHVLLDLTAETEHRPEERVATARRAWVAVEASGREAEWAPKLAQAVRDIPADRFAPDLLLALVRSLQRTGHPADAKLLLASNPTLEQRMPELTLERAMAIAREGPPARAIPLFDSLAKAWPPARYMLAEVQFFAGEMDSAHANYDRVAAVPEDEHAADALDRMYLLEESPQSPQRYVLAQIAYERWRGANPRATVLADSLWRFVQPHGDYAARAGLTLASLKMEAGDAKGALVPLLVVCDSLADDRLAPLARQRAGEVYMALGDPKLAQAQYEECLARYPRAWNSAEVRRRVERLRRERL
jgi:tetratricopeptide (TPR) repeat protein